MHRVDHFIHWFRFYMAKAFQNTSAFVTKLGRMDPTLVEVITSYIYIPAAMRWFHFIMSTKLLEHDVSWMYCGKSWYEIGWLGIYARLTTLKRRTIHVSIINCIDSEFYVYGGVRLYSHLSSVNERFYVTKIVVKNGKRWTNIATTIAIALEMTTTKPATITTSIFVSENCVETKNILPILWIL